MMSFVREVVVREVKGGPGSGNFGHAGRPGEIGGSGGGGGGGAGADGERTRAPDSERYPAGFSSRAEYEASNDFKVSKARKLYDGVQPALDDQASAFRSEGSQTYVSSLYRSPNMGERTFMDISNPDKTVESRQVLDAQRELDKVASSIRDTGGARTYVSSEKSPNMGTRVFIDVELKR